MQRSVRWIALAAVLVAVLLLGGCFGLGGSKSANKNGTLNISLVDAATNGLDEVNVRITRVEVNHDGKWELLNAFTNQGGFLDVNLLDLRFDKALLGETSLPAGAYTQIRLIVDDSASSVVIGGSTFSLKVPSGEQTGLKINHNFVVPPGGAVALVLDADVSEFVHKLGSKDEYIMSPTAVRVVDLQSGNIAGKVVAKVNNLPITSTDVAITVWLDKDNDGVKDDLDLTTIGPDYVAKTLALREALSGHEAGEFQVNALPALTTGRYIVEVSAPGYDTVTFTGIAVRPGATTVLDGDLTTPLVTDDILLSATIL